MALSRSNFSPDHDACGVGFITQLGGPGSHEIVARALEALRRLSHRGGVDADGRSGDGAGLLTRIPVKFIRDRAREAGIDLPRGFGLGMVFLPRDHRASQTFIEQSAPEHGLRCLGWRTVPIDASILGPRASETVPEIQQCFFAPARAGVDLERLLFSFRKHVEAAAPPRTYFCSLSSRTVVYKGLLTPFHLAAFYPDLTNPEFVSPFAIFHQRYSTNTQPSWSLAQPFRCVAHNGEINTIRANRRWLRARESRLCEHLGIAGPVELLEPAVSDSASLDNAFEIFLRRGFRPESAILSMVPPAWENDPNLDAEFRGFFEQQACEQEPWDGPAALIFTDGITVGAKLDRNGLRPLRYTLTSDGLLVVGSEAGIADLHGKQVVERQRLGPGQMLLVDSVVGTFCRPSEYPQTLGWDRHDGRRKTVRLGPTHLADQPKTSDPVRAMAALGWTEDQYRLLFRPLVEAGHEAVWSMGDDTPPAFLSSMRRPLWDHCKQRFAQVTNPPIDPLRESHVMSLDVYLRKGVILSSPLLDAGQMTALADVFGKACRVDFTFDANGGLQAAHSALEYIAQAATDILAEKPRIVVLSDRNTSRSRAALPALLALAVLWKGMVQAGVSDVPVIVETGQVIDTHHLALLVATGAAGVFPYLALEEAGRVRPDGTQNYRSAVEAGLRKVLARMGISTLASYRNSQLFEIIGLNPKLCAEFWEDADSVLAGKSLDGLLDDGLERHRAAFSAEEPALRDAGLYRFRHNGEQHSNSPELVRRMHRYIKSPGEESQRVWSELATSRQPVSIRDLLETVPGNRIPLHEVESEASLLSRFSTQAMSLGAISPEAHRTLAIAMNRLGGRSNTGEGGEDPDVYSEIPEANNRVKQVASGRFGVTAEYLVHADELEIKMAQGAKPGEGGQLPAAKVSAYIARLRHAVPNMALISPPPHHDIYSIEDLAQLIYDLRAVNPHARIGVKLVSGGGVGIIAAGVAKAGADIITISGYDGGTGASAMTTIKNTGLPWEIGLRDAHCALVRTGLRSRVRLRVDGGLKFARDVISAALLGAEEFGFGTAALLAIGCVMARQCHLNTCPVGIATQDEHLRARFSGNPGMVETYFRGLAAEVRTLLAELGASSIDEIVGKVELLRPRDPRLASLCGALLETTANATHVSYPREDDSTLHIALNRAVAALDTTAVQRYSFCISNSDRAIGAHLSGELVRGSDSARISERLEFDFVGTAGQSFGAFLVAGVNFRLTGSANDYVGKGLSGGTIAITAGEESSKRGDVLAGNTVLYGATSGELFIAGRAGERFAVRNSGALAVVEGVGQHGCEYMTAGVIVVLGPIGTNFGAGMTGGLAYVVRDHLRDNAYNQNSVHLLSLSRNEQLWLRRVLKRHLQLTGSPRAAQILSGNSLGLVRIEPMHRPCSVSETWATVLKRVRASEVPGLKVLQIASPEGPLVM